MTETPTVYEAGERPPGVDPNARHEWATSEEEARAAFERKWGEPPRYVVPASLAGHWMAGPIREVADAD